MRTVELFRHDFENGNRVVVTNKGVTIWDTKHQTWVMDASTLVEDNAFTVSNVKKYPGSQVEYKSLHPVKKPRRKAKRRK